MVSGDVSDGYSCRTLSVCLFRDQADIELIETCLSQLPNC